MRPRSRLAGRAFAALTALALAGACGSGTEGRGSANADDQQLVVATTVAPITSLAAAVIGDRADIRGVVPEGTNSHTFEPPPSVAEVLAEADVLLVNGLQLEEPTLRLARSVMRDDAPIVALGERTISEDEYRYDFSFPEEEGKPNPHLWTNPPMVLAYAEVIRDEVARLDPANADEYRRNTEVLAAAIDDLDQAMWRAFATVPPSDRKLLTYHDAYAYFADEYGWEVIGAIQVSDFGEPTAAEVADLIDQVRVEDLPAIFGSEVFPSPVLEQIGREAGVRYVDVLRDDDLPGDPGDPEHSLLELLRANYVVITEAMGGDARALRELDLGLPTPDRAWYP